MHSIEGIADAVQAVELDQNRQGRLSRMDALQGQAMAQAGVVRQQQNLALVQAALARLESNQFGRCLECDEWITQARIEFDPSVSYCISCAAKKERAC